MTSRKMLKKISEEKTVQKDLQRITKLFQLHHPYLLRFGCGVCARCGKMEGEDGDVKLRLCGGCKMRNYCSTRCQKFDWRNGHREVCKRLRLESGDGAKGKAEIDSSASATAAAPSCSMPLDEANIVAENTKKKKKRKKKRKKKQGNGEGGEVTAEAASGRAAATARKQGAAKEDRSVFESPNMFNFAVRISNGQCTDGRPCRAYVDPNLEVDLIDAQFAMALGMQLRPMAANLRLENKETGEVGSHRLYETRGWVPWQAIEHFCALPFYLPHFFLYISVSLSHTYSLFHSFPESLNTVKEMLWEPFVHRRKDAAAGPKHAGSDDQCQQILSSTTVASSTM